jgi:hypothetical protein
MEMFNMPTKENHECWKYLECTRFLAYHMNVMNREKRMFEKDKTYIFFLKISR